MKMIIDIPDEVYEICKQMYNNGDARCAEWHIAHGIPYKEKPQGDLISREALKKALNTELKDHLLYLPIAFKDLIDNAPTVEYTFEEAFQKTVCEQRLYCPERPQGEYVDISKLRLMTVEECAGHTIDYAMGWKACVEWIKRGGAE